MKLIAGSAKGKRQHGSAGLTLIEVVISMSIVATILMASAAAFSSTLVATDCAKRTTGAGIFLETTMEDISAQPYDVLLSLNGNTVFDRTNAADSRHSITLSVFQVELNLLQIDSVVTDLRTGRPVGRLTTLRSRR